MSEKALRGCFYRDCTLYVGEYILQEEPSHGEALAGSGAALDEGKHGRKKGSKKGDTKGEQKGGTKGDKNGNPHGGTSGNPHGDPPDGPEKEAPPDGNSGQEGPPGRGVLFHGQGKYIRANEMFAGQFLNGNYRKGIWIRYKNIHNLFYYMNIYHALSGDKDPTKKGSTQNLKNFLYVPLKEVNIYIGEFDDNMFNGFGAYYFYPFLYVGYFINNSMDGYGYMFCGNSVGENSLGGAKGEDNTSGNANNLFDFLFVGGEKGGIANRSAEKRKGEKDAKVAVQSGKTAGEETPSAGGLLLRVYEKLERMMKGGGAVLGGEPQMVGEPPLCEQPGRAPPPGNLVEKLQRDLFKNFKLQTRRKNQVKKIKKFLHQNERQNFFDIFKLISYEHLLYQGYFHKNNFVSTSDEQILHRSLFLQVYVQMVTEKVNSFRRDLAEGVEPQDLYINGDNVLYVLERKKKAPEGDNTQGGVTANAGTRNDAANERSDVREEPKESSSREEARNTSVCSPEVREGIPPGGSNPNASFSNEHYRDIIDLSLLKRMFEATADDNVECAVEVVTGMKLLKYKNTLAGLKTDREENHLDKATLNLNGHHQLAVVNIKCREDTSFSLNTNQCNIQSIHKIKMFLISSTQSSIIKYNKFFLYYIYVYVKNSDRKAKGKVRKKKG
ncbi:conserved Plasmodium protein, unknown function [Plasmodium vivax]|uniref:Uncharacterized protein n=2 Tax=Plasmodium vivax TaxID=5855 RepID=A5K508_PLAVS|nr:hypothetical protein, conserved [Plasmodium vivax]EDL45736.1 hypothetical protein, conserved [Plasmodium vivax]CAI7720634.1 conserved Plasmodium protein, unknown function [Plasmodium vivax]SCO67447.1 conserved Plasmodium protein, unknown function [Plasmodium vivax]VUZ96022.1 conserved Plasmodium protein, unknown function [Plasmodium vivax]|eukprot:XP_001615463.1 hypothetical protein [Plasmodium vivax Sal-1]